eukprot:29586-Pelagococcus_subviridis.AAC.6
MVMPLPPLARRRGPLPTLGHESPLPVAATAHVGGGGGDMPSAAGGRSAGERGVGRGVRCRRRRRGARVASACERDGRARPRETDARGRERRAVSSLEIAPFTLGTSAAFRGARPRTWRDAATRVRTRAPPRFPRSRV